MLSAPFSVTLATATSAGTDPISLRNMYLWDCTAVVTDTTPAAVTFVFVSGNNFTATAHGFTTGLKVVNTTTGSLPTGLTGSAEYVIVIDANTIAFATSQANALAGTAITITGAGTGTQTSTPQALAGTMVFQKSNVPISVPAPTYNFFTIATPTTAASQNVTATGSLSYFDPACAYETIKGLLTVTSGAASVVLRFSAKGQ